MQSLLLRKLTEELFIPDFKFFNKNFLKISIEKLMNMEISNKDDKTIVECEREYYEKCLE